MKKDLVMLAILDGYGIAPSGKGNAISLAKKPNLDYLTQNYPHTVLGASGEAVGLPDGQMGNSEVGHMNIGAGRIVYQSLTRVNIAVRNDELIKMPAIQKAIKNCLEKNSKLHIMGLLSDGGVHSHIDHILYLMERAHQLGVKEAVVHAFLDGRDVPPKSALTYLDKLQAKVQEVGGCKIGVISGRYYAMDRDKNWNREQLAYDALVYNKAEVKPYKEGILESYENGITDEFVVPFINETETNICEKDSVIFANFRPDRAIQISTALTNVKVTGIENGKEFKELVFVCMMLYSESVKGEIVFGVQELNNIFGEYMAKLGKTQLRIAETEKYAHVTFFFDGGVDQEYPGQTRILVASPKVATYDLKPEMSAYEVCDKAVEAIESEKFDSIILNFANCDMVGHTTVMDATIKAVETVDECVGRIYQAIEKVGGTLIIIADHGNADKMIDENNLPFSAHSTNPVPCIITRKGLELREGGNLGDVVPTMFDLMNIAKPVEMTGTSLIKNQKNKN